MYESDSEEDARSMIYEEKFPVIATIRLGAENPWPCAPEACKSKTCQSHVGELREIHTPDETITKSVEVRTLGCIWSTE